MENKLSADATDSDGQLPSSLPEALSGKNTQKRELQCAGGTHQAVLCDGPQS